MFGDSDEEVEKETEPVSRFEKMCKRPNNCGVAAFHEGTEESLLLTVEANAERNPQSVLDTIDDFCYSRHWMMHIGEVKGRDLDRGLAKAIQTARERRHPVIAVELGSYCGYSAVRIAMQLDGPGDLVISIDSSEKSIQWARRAVAHSELSDRVALICSTAEKCIPAVRELICGQMAATGAGSGSGDAAEGVGVDLLLIDHDKALYYSDLLVFEASGLLQQGAVVVSDNVLSFGQPKQDLLDHVRDPAHYISSELYTTALEYSARSLLFAATEAEYCCVSAGTPDKTELLAAVDVESALCETVDGLEVSIHR